MSNDIQQESERIHQNIVESISFLDALANRDAEIARLRKELEGADRVANNFAQTACQRGARMQVMRDYLWYSGPNMTLWRKFCRVHPEATAWFDDEGVPK
jgi:hypothetical protein